MRVIVVAWMLVGALWSLPILHVEGQEIGLNGYVRLGCWAGIHDAQAQTLETQDGNGLIVRYELSPDRPWSYWRVGSETPNLELKSEGQVKRVSVSADQVLRANQTWIVALGSDADLDELQSDVVVGQQNGFALTVLDRPAQLPDHELGLEGIDLLVLPLSQADFLAGLTESQTSAIVRWVRRGGRMLLLAGTNAAEIVTKHAWLAQLFGNQPTLAAAREISPGEIEAFSTSRDPLLKPSGAASGGERPRLKATALPEGGKVLLEGRTLDNEMLHLIVDYVIGLGRVTVIGFDFDTGAVADWPGRNRLLRRMFPDTLDSTKSLPATATKSTGLGFTDLAGQVRETLERPSRARAPFSWIVGVLLVYLILVGPADYFFINRVIGRSLAGWLTFPAIIVAFAAGLFYWHRQQQSPVPQSRQFDVVDIVAADHQARGFTWAQLEAPRSSLFDLQLTSTGKLMGEPKTQLLTTWQGVSGSDFGGLKTNTVLAQLPPYLQSITPEQQAMSGALSGVPFAAGGSKGISATWTTSVPEFAIPGLQIDSATESLRGKIVNPLNVDLLEPVLLYRNNVYLLPTRLRAKAELGGLERLQQKNFNWRLTRRKLNEGNSEAAAWDPSVNDNLPRLLEVLLFHSIAGGENYTGLQNRHLEALDLSYLLNHDRAILVGRVEQNASELVQPDGQSLGESIDHLTICRVIFPIQNQNQNPSTSPQARTP